MRERNLRTIVVIVLVILGCGLVVYFQVQRILQSFGGMGTCGGEHTVETWIDGNSNGTWDEGEAPLPEVEVLVEFDAVYPSEVFGEDVTDPDGLAIFSAFWHVNDIEYYGDSLKISAAIPSGYTRTTPGSYSAHLCRHATYSFGYLPKPETEPEP